MNKLSLYTIIMLASLLVGCSAVYSTKPVGLAPASITPEDWQGTWVHKDGVIQIDIVDAEKGIIRAAWIEDMKLKSFDIRLNTSEDWTFGSTKENPEDTRFVWGRIKREDNQLVIWSPSVSKFKKMVQDGVLPGTVDENGDITLGELSADHIKVITSETRGVLFNWDDPIVFIRLTK
jgi:hypothetical protein